MRATRRIIIASMLLASCQQQPKRTVSATITSIYPRVSRRHSDEVVVEFKSKVGLMARKTMPAALLHCKPGDLVQAQAQGINLRIDDKACL